MPVTHRVRAASLLTALSGFLAVGCSSSSEPNDPDPDPVCQVPTVAVTGLPDPLQALQQVQLTATIQPSLCATEAVTWSATAGLNVTASGQVTGTHLGGPFTVTATVKGVAANATTNVTMAVQIADARWALAWVDQPSQPEYAVSTFYSFSTGGAIRSTRAAAGTYAVRFPGLATGAGQRQVVQVSAYGGVPRRCRVLSWANDGADLVVQVRCHDLAGTLSDSWFDILVVPAGSVQGRNGFVVTPSAEGTGAIAAATAHNSSGGGIGVSRTGTGLYTVTFNGLARGDFTTPERETFHITAYGDGTNWCKISSWGPTEGNERIGVNCYNNAGALADARFSVLMLEHGRPGRRLGYVWAHNSASANYTPSTLYTFNSTAAVNTATRTSPGLYDVLWTGLGRLAGSTAETNLVTAYGAADNSYCQVGNWGNSDTVIRCYAPNGDVVDALYVAIWIE